jgi:hypothetical protein
LVDRRNQLRIKKRAKRKNQIRRNRAFNVSTASSHDSRIARGIWPRASTCSRSGDTGLILIPEHFSFLEDPVRAIATLDEFKSALLDRKIHRIFLDFAKCSVLDLCASSVMTVMALGARRPRAKNGKSFSGNYPATERAKILLQSSGLLSYIQTNAPILPVDVQSKLKVFPIRSGHSRRPGASPACDRATTRLVEYFDDCLASSVQIWLGKQLLGQKDHTVQENTGNVGLQLVHSVPQPQRED